MKKSEKNIEENKVREIIEDFFKEICNNIDDIKNKEILKDSTNLYAFVKNNHEIKSKKIKDFSDNSDAEDVPNKSGIYFVISLNDIEEWQIQGEFLNKIEEKEKFKPLSDLNEKFEKVKHNKNAKIVYIGKADGEKNKLHDRIVKQYMGTKYNHAGGRAIWQIEGAKNFYIAWIIEEKNAHQIESDLIQSYAYLTKKECKEKISKSKILYYPLANRKI